MSVIASLVVNVSGRTAAFEKAMGGVRKQAQSFAAGFAKIGALPGAALGVMGAVAGSAFGVAVKGSMDAADAAAKQSDQIGIATEKLIGLQHAGDLAGVSAEEVAKNLRKMQINLAKVADGGGAAAAEALDKMGLSAAALINLGPDAALKAIADGMLGIEDPAHRAQAATALFGKEGAAMISMLAGGSAGLTEAQREADMFGVAINRIDAAKVEAANDAITRISTATKGLATQVGVALAPFIELAAKKMQGLLTSGGGAAAVIRSGFGAAIGVLGVFADGVQLVQIGFLAARGAVQQFQDFAVSAFLKVAQGAQKLAGMLGLEGVGQGVVEFLDNLHVSLAGGAAEDFSKMLDLWSGQSASSKLKGWFEGVTNGADQAAEAAGNLNEHLSQIGDAIDTSLADDLKKLEDDLNQRIQVAKFGDTGAKINQLGSRGASTQDLNRLAGLDARASAEEFAKKMQTPFESFEKKLEDLDRLASVGAIDSRTLALGKAEAATEAVKAIEGKDKKNTERTVDSLSRGSAAAINAELAFLTGGKKDDEQLQVARDQLAAATRQLDVMKQQASLLAAIVGGAVEV